MKDFVMFSATDIYQQRSNRPTGGMSSTDVRNIVKNNGATLEVLAPSQNITDAQMDSFPIEPYKRQVGDIFKVSNYIELPTKDMETLASLIQSTGKGAMVWFYFQYDEWTSRPVVKVPNLNPFAPSTVRHSVTAVDFALIDGKKCIIIEDSWGQNFGFDGQRIIDEAFFNARNLFAGYLVNFLFDVPTTQKPQHAFPVDLEFGMTGEEVRALQLCLKWERVFPSNAEVTGYFGAITKKAVQDFQVKFGLSVVGRVGPLTRVKLNEIFA